MNVAAYIICIDGLSYHETSTSVGGDVQHPNFTIVCVCVWEEFEKPSSSFTKDAWFQTQPAQKTTMDENKERLRYVFRRV